MIEVEKRGAIASGTWNYLTEKLEKSWSLMGRYKQLTIFIEFDNPYLGTVENTRASISISIGHNLLNGETTCKLKAKTGKMQSSFRKEILIPFKLENIEDIKNFLEIFNIKMGCPRYYYREDYSNGEATLSIKKDGLAPDHFEIEKQVNDESAVDEAQNDLKKLAEDLSLSFYSEEEYKQIMLEVFKNNPPINMSEIDFSIIN